MKQTIRTIRESFDRAALNRMASRAVMVISALLVASAAVLAATPTYLEPWRPQFHFTPATNWMNDPNGMVFYDGEYHLFYQFNPFDDKWGHMSWGHAVSKDLVHWEHLPVALYEENDVMIFSGSAVVDWQNSSGFGKDGQPPLVAIYTGHYTKKPLQNQHIAYSNDRGRSWTKFAGNPVLDVKMADFRDPKVFWHEATARWVMTVALPKEAKVHFYSSPDLKQWKYAGEFGGLGATNGLWECPDLFPLAIEGGGEKWVLIVNINPGGPAGGSGCQYFVGEFNGARFKAENTNTSWADFGADFYAGVSWSDIPKSDGRRLWLGWMSNWQYANDVPTSPWRSAMSVPRELALRRSADGLRLVQQPARELARLRDTHHYFDGDSLDEANAWLQKKSIRGDALELLVEFEPISSGHEGVKLFKGAREVTIVGVDRDKGRVYVDRTRSGNVTFHSKFSGLHEGPLATRNLPVKFRIFVDAGSIEVFVNDGERVFTELVFPSENSRGVELFARESAKLRSLDVWPLKSIWRNPPAPGNK
jgi:fructan beta-fructosidase